MFDAEYRTGIPARIVDGGSIAGANHRGYEKPRRSGALRLTGLEPATELAAAWGWPCHSPLDSRSPHWVRSTS